MKLLLVCLSAMFSLAFAAVLQQDVEFKRTAEDASMNRFETVDLTSSDEDEEKRIFLPSNLCGDTCKSGYVQSKYCTTAAKICFGRGQIVNVRFVPAFKDIPKVVIGLTLVDTHKDHNVRVHATVESVTRTGFNIRFKPWDTSITYRIGVNWMACP
ncbi:Thioredoxin domain-containing 3 [Paramuricea clavata]|uniref:Thioredoxin domain-containing 3 n=1 Tax=Paramuricea clavata TaxID=317549 RepID=A0A6S7IWJ1_PARCT|nr:Thioredoxin domain-containing 3 [Paramuricea clavata]